MLSMRLISRGNLPQYAITAQRLHTSTLLLDSSDSSSSSDSDKQAPKKRVKRAKPVENPEQQLKSRQETTDRLNSLLDKMIKEPKLSKQIDLSVPPKKKRTDREPREKSFQEKLVGAAKGVATALGGDVNKTESDLLNKLLSVENNKSDDQQKEKKTSTPFNLAQLVTGMKIDRTPQETSERSPTLQRLERVQALSKKLESRESNKFKRWSSKPDRFETDASRGPSEPGNLYGGVPLDIFNVSRTVSEATDAPVLSTWEALEKREFRQVLTHPPENIFQEMIQWTEQGKLWKFPIDNEQGMEEEQNVHFSEHVFMERHLQDWCPKRGPIRHFMELVCVGLSKNPYMTVNEKKEHIRWYRDYFGSKEELLRELGAIEVKVDQPKQIET